MKFENLFHSINEVIKKNIGSVGCLQGELGHFITWKREPGEV